MEVLRLNRLIRARGVVPALPCGRARCRNISTSAHATRSRERVLRYPDGHERRIIYPAMVTLDLDEEDDEERSSWDVTGLWTGAAAADRHAKTGLQQRSLEGSLQDTAAFLEGLFAASYASQPLEDVAQSYEVLDGCPWPLPRPVFVLTSQQWGWQAADGIQSTYTLRVKVVQEGAADAIAKLLNKQHLAAALDVAEMRDGLVMFEAPEDADRFASKLEEEGHSQVMVAEIDSHKAFRLVSELKALAVLLREGVPIPAPYQLAASLKQQKSWDDK